MYLPVPVSSKQSLFFRCSNPNSLHISAPLCAYAHNIVIVTRTQKKLTEVYRNLEEETSKLGMEIN